MARDLNLKVMLSAVDEITAPLRSIARGSSTTAQALKANRDQLKLMQTQQRDVSSFRTLQKEMEENGQAMTEARAKVTAYQESLERQRTIQQGIAAETKVQRAAVRELHKAMISAKAPNEELNRQYSLAKNKLEKLEATYFKSNSHLRQIKRSLKETSTATANLNAKSNGLSERLAATRAKLDAAGISTDRLGDEESSLTTRIEEANRALAQHEARLKAATKHQERLNKVKEQYERTQGLAGSMSAAGAAGVATGSAILYAGARMAAPGMAAQQQGALIAAQNGEAIARAKEYEAIIRGIRADGLSDDMAAIGSAVAAVKSTLGDIGDAELERASRKAMDLAAVMGGDVAEHVQTVGILMQNSLAKNSDEAFDLITAGMQNVSAQMRGELPEILHEYSTFFRGMGFSGKEAMSLLVAQAKQGKFALDKTGDAIKEFSIRGSDMSKASVEAYEAMGLSAEQMSAAIAGGGEGARKALQQTAKGLLAIKSPAERANAAIALFGAPVEDLSVDQIPAFLQKIAEMPDNLGNVSGAAAQLGKTLNDNLAGDIATLSGSWSELNSTMMDSQNGPLREFVQSLTETIRGIRAWVQENPALAAGIVKAVAGFGMLAAIFGAVTLALASFLGPFAMVRYGLLMIGLKLPSVIALVKMLVAGFTAMGGPVGVLRLALGGLFRMMFFFIRANPFAALVVGVAAAIMHLVSRFDRIKALFQAGEWMELGMEIVNGIVAGLNAATLGMLGVVAGVAKSMWDTFAGVLGIHSPSRVFAELGGDTMAGLDQGLRAGKSGPLAAVSGMGKQLAAAGALTMGMGAGSALAIDNRPPLAAYGPGAAVAAAPSNITINVQAGPGMDEAALAKLVAREVQRITSQQAASGRSLLADRE